MRTPGRLVGTPGLLFRIAILAGLVALTAACGPGDPRQAALEERERWKVELLSWAASDNGGYLLSVRVSGPFDAKLQTLTVWTELVDAAGDAIDAEWTVIDLSEVQRGGPKDLIVLLSPRELEAEVDGIRIDTVPSPTPEQEKHLKELG